MGTRPTWVITAAVLATAPTAARADDPRARADDPRAYADDDPRGSDDPVASASAGLGAGFLGGEAVSAAELRGDLAWDGGAIGLGARLRLIGTDFARADWDEVGDWLALLRYLVLRNDAERDVARMTHVGHGSVADDPRWRAAFAAGPLAPLQIGPGTLVDGFTAATLADRRATGAHLRIGRGATGGELAVGDLARGTFVALSGDAPAGPVIVGGTAAIDPRAPVRADMGLDTAPLAALAAHARVERRTTRSTTHVGLSAGWQPSLGVGAAAVAGTDLRLGDRTLLRGRVELGAGTGGWIQAPFGPLYLRLRDVAGASAMSGAPAPTLLDRARAGELAGVGGAASVAVDVDDVGSVAVSGRVRPGLGTEVGVRASAPAASGVQAAALAAWIPGIDDALVVGAEAHVELRHHLWSGLELSRQYRAGETPGLYAERPVWQVTAWFGVTR